MSDQDPKKVDRTAAENSSTRRTFQFKTRSYDAATGGRLNPQTSWLAISSADTEIFAAARTLRDRSRDLVRNNPYAAKAVDTLCSNIIGTGIRPRANSDDPVLNKLVNDLFGRWSEAHVCDADGQYGFFGLQLLAVREMIEGGEVLVRRRIVSDYKDGTIPLQLQLLEADFLDPFRNGPLGENVLVNQGVGTSLSGPDIGKRVCYWLYEQHPGNFVINTAETLVSKPVDASEVLHCYEKQRTQVRGVPWGTPSFETLEHLAEYETAELIRKRTESCVAAIITASDESDFGLNLQPDGMPGEPLAPGVYGADGVLREHMEPGMIVYAPTGKTVAFNSPNSIGGYGEYKSSQLHSVATGWRVPYELLSGDFSQVSFISGRLGLNEFRRFIVTVQQNILIPMLLRPIWAWFCEAAYLAGLIPTSDIPVVWSTPAFAYVNPSEDVASDLAAIRAGFKSYVDIAYENGRDPETLWQDVVDFQRKCAADDVVLDSNPKAVNGRGAAQKNPVPDEVGKPKKNKKGKNGKKNKKDKSAKNASTALVDGLPPAE